MAYNTGPIPLYKVQKEPYTIEAPGCKPVENETIPRRHPKAKNGLLECPAPNVRSTFDILKRSVEKYGDEPAIGSRKLIKVHKEKKKIPKVVDGKTTEVEKEWSYFELSNYSYLTYKEYFQQILQVGAGLKKLGLSSDDRLHIFATTSYVFPLPVKPCCIWLFTNRLPQSTMAQYRSRMLLAIHHDRHSV